MARVLLKNIKKVYPGGFEAVHNANVDIQDKEFIVLVGPSGCGKSTTLRMIAGLEDISSGELIIDDKVVNFVPPKDRDIAMVFQNYALYPHMNTYDNMAFGLKIRKMPRLEIEKRVKEAAKILHIEDQLTKKPKALSGGQRQRVAMGRAIVRKPKVFLFDEPLSNLDAKLRVAMRAELALLHSKIQTTVVYVTHDQVEAMTLGHRIVVMKDGYIQQVDKPLTIYNSPVNKFVAGFIGSPPMNFLKVTVKKSGDKTVVMHGSETITPSKDQQQALSAFSGKEVTFGIRPEDLVLDSKVENKLSVTVDVIEPLGAETYLYLTTKEGNQLIASVDPHGEYKLGNKIDIGIIIKKAHYFESVAGSSDEESEEKCII